MWVGVGEDPLRLILKGPPVNHFFFRLRFASWSVRY